MVRKLKSISPKRKSTNKNASRQAYPSLVHGLSPARRRANLEKELDQKGIKPIEHFDQFLDEMEDFWPKNETCDEFIAWLRKSRRQGRY